MTFTSLSELPPLAPEALSPDATTSIRQALAEDAGHGPHAGDHTSRATVPAKQQGRARLLVKQPGVLAGVDLACRILGEVDPSLHIHLRMRDGAIIQPGDEPFYLSGSELSILTAERIVLNFMQRMSGIATLTRTYTDRIAHTPCRLLDTRKTTPGLRWMEKWAVRIGGGYNHRMGLYDMVMIKDNHVDFSGGIAAALDSVVRYQQERGLALPVEIETRNLKEVQQVLDHGAQHGMVQRIMLDNYPLPLLREAVGLIARQAETEASGGVTLDTVAAIAETGVDFISVGALTHSAIGLDLSLKAL
ncbi:MAG: carboxylating nicotinate-nucleotide diphosphorylase [Bacteroidetes bacterium]|nr:carboxylating nicotinate-nucleotide diphosphorylase [Bacteroidota bacterium]